MSTVLIVFTINGKRAGENSEDFTKSYPSVTEAVYNDKQNEQESPACYR
jgi:hypothetical protein